MNLNKQKFLMVMLACLGSLAVSAQTVQKIGNNSMTISPSAALEIESTTKGLLLPRMTTTQRGNVISPVDGLIIYNTGTNSIEVYSAVSGLWKSNVQLAGDLGGTAALPTLLNSAVIGKVLTGYTSGAGIISSSDNLLQAIQKLDGNKATNANLTGEVTSTGNAAKLGSFTSASLSTAITDETGTGVAVFDTSPTLIGSVSGDNTATTTLAGFAAKINVQTGTTYTLLASDNGKIINISNASVITVTVPSLFPGFSCMFIQTGAGTITFTASGTTILNRSSFTKTAGQGAIATLIATASAYFYSSGDMQ